MNTTAVHIDTRLYNNVAEYARRHNTSIDSMVESYFVAVLSLMHFEHSGEGQKNAAEADEEGTTARHAWQNRPISEETKRLLPKRRVNIPTDYKLMLEQGLKEKYDSLS